MDCDENTMLDRDLCDRIIHPSSREKRRDNKTFWLRLFEALEHDASIPFHRRHSILSVLFKSLKGIITGVYKLEKDRAPAILRQFFLEQHTKIETEPKTTYKIIPSRISTSLASVLGDDDIFEALESPVGLTTFLRTSQEQIEDAKKRVGCTNPYTNFFNLAKVKRAAIWRQLPTSSYTQLKIEEKVATIVDYVADEFVNWTLQMWDLTDQRHMYIDAVKKMFNIEIGMHAATSMRLRLKQMTSIPDNVAHERGFYNMSEKETLRQELRRDIEWCIANENNPAERQCNIKKYKKLKEQITNKWMRCTKYPKKLITMATVWEGTSHLKSTRKFCEYLIEHPKIKPPQYLIDNGLLSKEFLKQQEESEAELHYIDESRVASSINLKIQ